MSLKNVALFAIVAAGICFLGHAALNASERQECARWSRESKEISAWYATDWQIEQCKAHGVTLPAGK